jgi:hypothetical protein
MKKNWMMLLLGTLLMASTSYSQAVFKPAIGMNFTDFSQSQNGEARAKVGYQIGGSFLFGRQVYLEPGLFFMGKSTEFTQMGDVVTFQYKMQGFRVPVSVGVNLSGKENAPVNVRLFGGGSAFFVTSTSGDLDKSQVNTTHWGLHAGAGLDLYLFFLDASYEWSLTDVQKTNTVTQFDVGKSRSLYLNAGLRIPLGNPPGWMSPHKE